MKSISAYWRTFKKIPRVLRHLQRNAAYSLNDEHYWDEYSREWRDEGKFKYLGDEWTNQEVFLATLRRYAAKHSVALEIGCGGGRITAQAAECFGLVHACDVSRRMLQRCKEAVPESNVRFHRLDGYTLAEFSDDSIDLVYSHDVFVHFSSLQVYPYLMEIRRVLKPGGMGLISFTDFASSFAEFKKTSLLYFSRRWIPPHMRIHFITREMVERMLDDLGLETKEVSRQDYLVLAFAKPLGPGKTSGQEASLQRSDAGLPPA